MATMHLKVYLQRSIRRFTITTDTTYEQFVALFKDIYPQEVNSLLFQYVDDEEDLVSFSTQHEWENALKNHVESKAKLLRVKVRSNIPQRQQQRSAKNLFNGPRYRDGLFKQFSGLFSARCASQQKCGAKKEDNIEKLIEHCVPILKNLFGVEIEIKREQSQQNQEKKPEITEKIQDKKEGDNIEEKKEEHIEEIVIDDEAPLIEGEKEEKQVVTETFNRVEQAPVVTYAIKLEKLKNMGFTNEKLNVNLLKTYKGDLVRAVNALVQLSTTH
jgi:hypothetical protein